MLKDLSYWNVDLQEAYFSPIEVKESYNKFEEIDFISIGYVSKSTDLDLKLSFFLKFYSTLLLIQSYSYNH